MRSNQTKCIALSGLLAAVAVVIMCMGGLVPIATYVTPILCSLTQLLVFRFCGKRLAWTWFASVSVLSLLLCPDKEAAFVFIAIGYYPLIKRIFERCKLSVVLKLLYFNFSILAIYGVMIYVFGLRDVAAETMELGLLGLAVLLVLGNVTFFMLDRLLTIMVRKMQ